MAKKTLREKKEGLFRQAFSSLIVAILLLCLPIILPIALFFGIFHLIKSIWLGFEIWENSIKPFVLRAN